MKEVLLFIVGVPLGLWWSTVTILPLLYGVPKAAYYAWQGRLRNTAVFFYFRLFLFWFFLVGVLGFLLLEYAPALAVIVRESVGLNSGQLLGFIIGVGGVFTASGRKDLDADFWALMQAKNFTQTSLAKEQETLFQQRQEEALSAFERYKETAAIEAAKGVAWAQSALGEVYYEGLDVPQDYVEAAKWFRLAAAQGYARAQGSLGVMYEQGQGVPQDYMQAHKWFNLAEANSKQTEEIQKKAAKARELVAAKMTPAQIAEAQKLAREWKPTTQEK